MPPLVTAVLLALLLLGASPMADPAAAQDGAAQAKAGESAPGRTGRPLPRFAALKSDTVNLRSGPGVRYPIQWVFKRRGLPVQIVDEYDHWRRIRDWEGTEGWVHRYMLSGKRTVRVTAEAPVVLRRAADERAPGVARVSPGAIGTLEACESGWCRIEVGGFEGWLQRRAFYGTLAREELR